MRFAQRYASSKNFVFLITVGFEKVEFRKKFKERTNLQRIIKSALRLRLRRGEIEIKTMKDFTTYLSTAPVVGLGWAIFTAGLLIEINRFFPDPLVFSF